MIEEIGYCKEEIESLIEISVLILNIANNECYEGDLMQLILLVYDK